MAPQSFLMAPAHLAVGKFISHKQAGAQWDQQKLSLAWHHQPQQYVSDVRGKRSRIYVHFTHKEVT